MYPFGPEAPGAPSRHSNYDLNGSVPSGSTRETTSSVRPSTSLSKSRPSTASGRKSRTSYVSSILGLSETQSIVCAVAEGKGVTPSVGVAFINVSLGEVILCQICDNLSYVKTIHKMQIFWPSRVIFQPQACDPNKPSALYSLVEELLPDAQVALFERAAWSESEGLDLIQDLAFRSDVEPLKVAIQGKYYAVASFSAVSNRPFVLSSKSWLMKTQAMKYIKHHFGINFVSHSLRVKYQPSEDTMMIDISAMHSLEIMQNQYNPKSKDCLFGLLNQTCTPMGARFLRSNMVQPPTRHDSFITPRYDAVEELTANEEMFREVRKGKAGEIVPFSS